jgi:hypothetical protein
MPDTPIRHGFRKPVARALGIAALFLSKLIVALPTASAGIGDCAQPTSSGEKPTASDCLFILNAAVGARECNPACACAPGGQTPATATDALICLNAAVGVSIALECPCSDPLWFPLDPSQGTDLGHAATAVAVEDRVDAGPVDFDDTTLAAGLGHVVGGGNTHGVGVAFIDLTNDGWEDIVVVNGAYFANPQQFDSYYYVNDADGAFSDNAFASGFAAIMEDVDGYSVAAADYDNDGDVDLYIGAHPTDILLQNQGDGSFTDATTAAGAGGPITAQTHSSSKIVSFGDYNGDGHIDLVSASSDIPGPGLYLLENNGNGTFTDTTEGSGAVIAATGNPCAVLWTDYDSDTDADLQIWNDRGGRVLLRNDGNNGDATFTDVTTVSSINAEANISNPMGIDGADIDHDGDLDYYVSNVGNNPLLLNHADGTFTNITSAAGTGGDFGWGLGFEDFDLDSFADIFVAQEDNLSYIAFTNDRALPPTFTRIDFSHPSVVSLSRAHNVAVAFADYDHDGRVDILSANTDGTRITLYRNTTEVGSNRWLEVHVSAAPGNGTAGATTARVFVKAGPLLQFREIYGGSSRASQNAQPARFGLGQRTGADWVAVQWPDGREIIVRNVEGNQRLVLDSFGE